MVGFLSVQPGTSDLGFGPFHFGPREPARLTLGVEEDREVFSARAWGARKVGALVAAASRRRATQDLGNAEPGV